MQQQKKTAGAYVALIASMFIFGTIGIVRRYVNLSSGVIACVRGLLGAGCLALYIPFRRGSLPVKIGIRRLLLLALSGGLIGFNWILLFEAYNYTSVATATLCYYMAPTILVLTAPLLFRERLRLRQGLCALAAVIGMVLVSGVLKGATAGQSDGIGILLGLGAAALYASVVILNKIVRCEDIYRKTMIQLLSAAVILLPYLLLTEDFSAIAKQIDTLSLVLLLVMGIVHTGFAYALYFGSLAALPTQSVAVISYVDPVSALLLSALFLQERLTLAGTLGAILIIGAALVSEIHFSGKSEKSENLKRRN